MKLGEYIKNYRASHGIGQREFAEMCGISAGYVSMLENNKHPKSGKPLSPRIEIYQQVAAATGIGLDELIAIVDDNITIVPNETEKSTVGEDDGLSERERQLIQFVRRLSDKQVDGLLDLLRSQQPQEK